MEVETAKAHMVLATGIINSIKYQQVLFSEWCIE